MKDFWDFNLFNKKLIYIFIIIINQSIMHQGSINI